MEVNKRIKIKDYFFRKEMEKRVMRLLFFSTNLVEQVNSEQEILKKIKTLKYEWVKRNKGVTAE